MVIIETKGQPTKEFFGEYQALRLRYKKLIKKPCMKLKSAVTNAIAFTSVLTVLTVFYVLYSYYTQATFIMVWTILLAAITFLYIVYSAVLLKTRKKFLSEYKQKTIIVDNNGISLNSEKQNVLVKWESIKYIIINRYTIGIIPDNAGNLMLALSTDYKDDIIKGVAEYSHSDLIVDNSFLYR